VVFQPILRLSGCTLCRRPTLRLQQWYRLLLEETAQERLEPRRNRANPRGVKRKRSKFAKKRPEHRHRPSLKKTFAETVVIT
jgi:hypothetical protein